MLHPLVNHRVLSRYLGGIQVAGEPVKLNFELSRELNNRVNAVMPHGTKKVIVEQLLKLAVDLVETGGPAMLGLLMGGMLRFTPTKEAREQWMRAEDS